MWYDTTKDTANLYWKRPTNHPVVECAGVMQKLLTTTPDKINRYLALALAAIKEHGTDGMTAHIKKALA